MENEIDLYIYINAIKKKWKWLLLGTMIVFFVSLIISFQIPEKYEATAIVVVSQPRDLVQFDERFRALKESQPLNALPELALSDELIQQLLNGENQQLNTQGETFYSLRRKMSATAGKDPSLIKLTIKTDDPVDAVVLTNKWAEQFTELTNELYGNQGGGQVQYFEEQLADAETELKFESERLIDFREIDGSTIISATLNSNINAQIELLNDKRDAETLLQDATRLRDQIARRPGNVNGNFSEQLTLLALHLEAYNIDMSIPMQFAIDSENSFIIDNAEDQVELLDAVIKSLQFRILDIDKDLDQLEPQIFELQRELQEFETEKAELVRNFDIAQETYMSLARKVDEERITTQDTSSGAQLASRAVAPQQPSNFNKVRNAAVAAVLGFFVLALAMLAMEWIGSEDVN